MRPITLTILIAGLCVGLGVSTAAAQSLGDLAKSEKERRKGGTKGVITEDDLAKRGAGRTSSTTSGDASAGDTGASASKGTGSTDASKGDEDPREKARKAWEERQKKAQEEVDRLTKQVDDLQQGLGDARNTQLGGNRKRVADQLDETRAKLADAQQRLDDLEEERRREGF